VGLGGLSEQRPASSPSPVQGPNRIKHRLSFGLVFSCQGFCNLCQPRGAPANQTILTAAEFMSRLCASMCRSAFCRDDCFGSLALITARSRDVRLTPESDLKSTYGMSIKGHKRTLHECNCSLLKPLVKNTMKSVPRQEHAVQPGRPSGRVGVGGH